MLCFIKLWYNKHLHGPCSGAPLRNRHHKTGLVPKEVYRGKGRGPRKGTETERGQRRTE